MSFNTEDLYNISGIQLPSGACVVIVRTEWNSFIVDKLQQGCVQLLEKQQVNYKIIHVPGAFEISFAIKKYWESTLMNEEMKPDAFIALGCVIKGGTPHFDFVCKAVTDGIVQLNLLLPIPTIFGVLTVDTEQQALERVGGAAGNKGEEAAITAIKMIGLAHTLDVEMKKN